MLRAFAYGNTEGRSHLTLLGQPGGGFAKSQAGPGASQTCGFE